jgi:pilus assembly protein CpaE
MRNPTILVVDSDPQLSEQVRRAASALRPRPDVRTRQLVEDAIDPVRDEGPFDVLVAGPVFGTRQGLELLRTIRSEVPGSSLVLAFRRKPDANLQDIVRTGALDLLRLPVTDDALRSAIERAIEFSAESPRAVSATEGGERAPGKVFTVASASGGAGKTFLATNLAYFLASERDARTCIVDLDLEFGELATALRMRTRYTISDVLARDDEDPEDLQAHIEDFLAIHDTGVRVLAAPKDPVEADDVDPAAVTRLLRALQRRFDYVVVDTPPSLSGTTLAALDLSDRTFVVATLDLPSLRRMAVLLNTFERLKVPSESLDLVINKTERDLGIDFNEVRKLFPQGFATLIPYAREVSKALNLGVPILAYRPKAEVSHAILKGFAALQTEPASRRSSGARRSKGVLGLLTKRSMVARPDAVPW